MEASVIVKTNPLSTLSCALKENKSRCSFEPYMIASSKPRSLRRRIVSGMKTALRAVKQALRGACSVIGDRIIVILEGTMYVVGIVAGVIVIILGVTILLYVAAASCY